MDELAFDLAGCMEKYFDIRGMYADWRAVNGYVLEACRAAGNLRGEAAMLRGLTDVMTWNSTDQDGEAMAGLLADSTSLLRMFTALGDRRGMSDAGVMRSWALSARGAYAEASREATEALLLAEETGHLGGTARAQVALALVFAEQGQFGEAITHLTRALERARAVGNPRYESAALQFLGIAHLQADNLDASQQVLSESLVISRRYRDHYTEVLTTLVQAKVYLRRGDRRAEPAALSSLALGREFTMPHHVADALAVLGEINLRAGRQAEAVTCLEESVRLWRTRGWPAYLAATLTSLGSAYGDADPRAAREAWQEARELFCGLGRDREVDQLTRQLADGTSAPRSE
jgi:tetratricopeptide (TPR) repeat protein